MTSQQQTPIAGPRPKPWLGNVADFGRDPLGFITGAVRDYGSIVRLQIEPHRDTYLVSDPALIEHVLVSTNRTFAKGYQRDPIMHRVLGNGLVTSEGNFWLRQRRLMQPVFHRQRIAGYAGVMVNYTGRMLATWRVGEIRDLHADLMQLTMEIIAKTIFDVDLHHDAEAASVGQALNTVLEEYNRQMTSVYRAVLSRLPIRLPVPGEQRLHRAVAQLDQLIYRLIRERRGDKQERDDLLTLLLATRDEDGSEMTDTQLRDEVLTLFLAGHETTANALSWAWYLLGSHPATAARLRVELATVLAGRAPTLADIPHLTYTNQIIKEAMRLYPPVWWISRETLEDWPVGEHVIPAGAEVSLSQWVLHRSPELYNQPDAFRPERWTEAFERSLPKYAYFPFGGGPRLCIGNSFALMEAALLLSTIAQQFDLKLVPGYLVVPEPSITLRPQHGLKVELTRNQER
ncbi:MAG: cytochrome P450 [Chloroflexi bacterium OHK40]